MMNISLNPPCRWLTDSTEAENQIREIFYQHWERMKDQFLVAVNQITVWRNKMIEDTNKYANEQIQILATDFDHVRLSLNEKCEENLDTTRAYYGANNSQLFNELRDACRLLEVQMAQLESTNGTLTVYKVITIQEQMERKKKEISSSSQSENHRSNETLLTEHVNETRNNREENGSLFVTMIPPILNQTLLNSSTIASSTDDSQVVNSNTNSTIHLMHANVPLDKCPVCCMIFPMNMPVDDRSQHVNEHCTDN